MNMSIHKAIVPVGSILLLASCAGVQPVAQHADDVYYMPSQAPPPAPISEATNAPVAQDKSMDEDYYDATTSQQFGAGGSYYDMAYNDPYYYNYGRFGFGSNMGWQNGWNASGWGMGMNMGMGGMGMGMGMGWGYGTGVFSGWYGSAPYWGYTRWPGFGYGHGWDPWAWYNDPYYYNGYGHGYGSGYGNYWGPWGNCASCYTPVVIGGASGSVVGHRPSLSRPSGGGSATYRPRAMYRDPVGLTRGVVREGMRGGGTDRARSTYGRSSTAIHDQGRQPGNSRPTQRYSTPSRTIGRPGVERSRSIGRSGGFDRGGGGSNGGSMPSRSGGGSRSPAPSHRH